MKKLLVLAGWFGFAVTGPLPLHAAESKKPATPPGMPASNVAAITTAARPLPYQGVVSRVDPAGKTFTITTKAGKDHVFTITAKTQIVKDDAPATLEDIKAAGVVRGSRLKLGENQWEALKVIIGAKVKAS